MKAQAYIDVAGTPAVTGWLSSTDCFCYGQTEVCDDCEWSLDIHLGSRVCTLECFNGAPHVYGIYGCIHNSLTAAEAFADDAAAGRPWEGER